ncbi:MAG: FAD-binding oxidoreductase [Chitinivibrionales bacterium]
MRIIQGHENIKQSAADILSDESGIEPGFPERVFLPENPEEIREALHQAKDKGMQVVISSGLTGITGGGVPDKGNAVISLSKMKGIKESGYPSDSAIQLTCMPGTTLDEIEEYLSEKHRGRFLFPPDPTEQSANLGGAAANDASGARSFKYGSIRNFITGMKVILPKGGMIDIDRKSVVFRKNRCSFPDDTSNEYRVEIPETGFSGIKNTAGYFCKRDMDLIDLFIGSEGTIGIIGELRIRCIIRPEFISGLSFLPDHESAFGFADMLRKHSKVSALEFFDSNSLEVLKEADTSRRIEVSIPKDMNTAVFWEYAGEGPEDIPDFIEDYLKHSGSSFDTTWSGMDEDEADRLRAFRHSVPEGINTRINRYRQHFPEIHKLSTDSALPEEHFNDYYSECISIIRDYSLNYAGFGHLGDYHIHFNILPSDHKEYEAAKDCYSRLIDTALKYNGSVSAEHGIGRLKRNYFRRMYSDAEYNGMLDIKRALDPDLLLNPGIMF